ncbi:MAG: hypothetical protein M3422_17610 [Actinomycetota bacterium]|nr:hypothetical protein [Actinomycetota bacterium]
MTDTTTTGTKEPTDPRPPCTECGSTDHTTGYHDNNQPAGYHDNAVPAGGTE